MVEGLTREEIERCVWRVWEVARRGGGRVQNSVRASAATGHLPPHAPSLLPPHTQHHTGSCSSSKPASTRSRSTPATRETRRCDWGWEGGVCFCYCWPRSGKRAPRVAAHTRADTLEEPAFGARRKQAHTRLTRPTPHSSPSPTGAHALGWRPAGAGPLLPGQRSLREDPAGECGVGRERERVADRPFSLTSPPRTTHTL